MDEASLRDWVGREESAEDWLTPRLASAFNAAFDDGGNPPEGAVAPRGIHWCLAPPAVNTAALGPDGHPARGGFLPPVALPRRMWAGGSLTFHGELHVGEKVTRRSRITAVTMKQGGSGQLCFVTLAHEIFSEQGLAIEERQDIVYRAAQTSPASPPPPAPTPAPQWRREMRASPVMLFRYSALTFNGHRIHYDRDYATQVEHYPGLVVHGPLQATLLLRFAAGCGKAEPRAFSFRGLSPLADFEAFSLNARTTEGGLELWVEADGGRRTMQARALF